MMKLMAICFFLIFSLSTFAIHEQNYTEDYNQIVFPFLKSGNSFEFKVEEKLNLKAISFLQPTVKDLVIVINGRSESWLKYGEVFYDLYQKGFSVTSYDHRGQGLSPRLIKNHHDIGYVRKFQDYVNDLGVFVKLVKNEFKPQNIYILAHSMGGLVTAIYLTEETHLISKAVLSAPMMEVNTEPYNEFVALLLSDFLWFFGQGESYAPGKTDYDENETFEKNDVTHSPQRFAMARWLNSTYPQIKLGGPSINWVKESLESTGKLKENAKKIITPVLLFQAENDKLVKPSNQITNCKLMKNCRLQPMSGANHEMLMERDEIRTSVMNQIFEFFN